MLHKYLGKDYGSTCAVRKIKIEDAVGNLLAHDITEVRPGEFKGVAFNAGHMIKTTDLCHLKRLGRKYLFVINSECNRIHENAAAVELAEALLGQGITFLPIPKEGKIKFQTNRYGLFKVNPDSLLRLNMIPEIMCTSIHNNTVVNDGKVLATVGVMPLFMERNTLDQAIDLIFTQECKLEVKPFRALKTHLIITGNEIYDGLVEDGFKTVIEAKLEEYGSSLLDTIVLPDDARRIASSIRSFLKSGTDLIFTTGGMSIDPDDVTRHGVYKAGADRIYYGAAVTPGAMFQLAYFGDIPIVSIPACALYHKTTVLDLVLPRLLVGERLDGEDLARLAHGGMCMTCKICTYPCCPFGKG